MPRKNKILAQKQMLTENNNSKYFDLDMLRKLIGDLLPDFIIPIENNAEKHEESTSELQRTILAINKKTKSILAPLSNFAVEMLAGKLETERKANLEVAINNLFYCEPQSEEEQVEAFASRVQYLANECLSLIALGDSGDKPEQTSHIRKMQYFIFISGLKCEVKRWVVRKMPEDFVKAVVIAMLVGWKLDEVKSRICYMQH